MNIYSAKLPTLLLPLSDHRHLVDYFVTVFGVRLHTQKSKSNK